MKPLSVLLSINGVTSLYLAALFNLYHGEFLFTLLLLLQSFGSLSAIYWLFVHRYRFSHSVFMRENGHIVRMYAVIAIILAILTFIGMFFLDSMEGQIQFMVFAVAFSVDGFGLLFLTTRR